jgi:hypothetical protein
MIGLEKQEKIFTFVIYSCYILYFLTIFGLSRNAPEYLKYLQLFIQMYVCLFLIIRFNPFLKTKFTSLDKRVAFSAGLFIFTTTFISEILVRNIEKIKDNIQKKYKL